jgi:hypothetical protein
MAGGARDGFVLSRQGEAGGFMVEVPGIFDLVKRSFRMAFRTVLTEPVFVHIPVAVCATFMINPPEHLGFLSVHGNSPVAFGAIYILMFSLQPEVGVIMIESGCRTETFVSVAGDTVCIQSTMMEIVMTIQTLMSQSQVGTITFY